MKKMIFAMMLMVMAAGNANAATAGDFTPESMDNYLKAYGGTMACHSVGIAATIYAQVAKEMGISDPDKADGPSDVFLMRIIRSWKPSLPLDMGILLSSSRYLIHNDDLKRDVMIALQGLDDVSERQAAAYAAVSAPCVADNAKLSSQTVREGVVAAFKKHYME